MKINECFLSVNGEVNSIGGQGTWAHFIRLQGCNLRCSYCFGVKPGRRIPKIITAIGVNKQLPEVVVGDRLLTFDNDKKLVETEVINTIQRTVTDWVEVTIGGKQYFVTNEHPFFTSRGVVTADQLVVGDNVTHATFQDKISFTKTVDNPMKRPEVALKKVASTNYKEVGKKISIARLGLSYGPLSEEHKYKLSLAKLGSSNPNWKGGKHRRYEFLKLLCKEKKLQCSLCGAVATDVHHKDGNRDNDSLENLASLCHSCHSITHEVGYNFWKGERSDGKMLVATNGLVVSQIRKINVYDKPPSIRPNPLVVYNLTCSPYDTYLIDYMWVHNCDTVYAQNPDSPLGEDFPVKVFVEETLIAIAKTRCKRITITGGEPLLQAPELIEFAQRLLDQDDEIRFVLETNGSYTLSKKIVDLFDCIVMDYKLGKEEKEMRMGNLEVLTHADYIKFVIVDVNDYQRAKTVLKEGDNIKARVAMSPCSKMLPDTLLTWMRQDGLMDVQLNVQLHKLIGVR
jgi:7-carboxy-7-deazaguanine synthase